MKTFITASVIVLLLQTVICLATVMYVDGRLDKHETAIQSVVQWINSVQPPAAK